MKLLIASKNSSKIRELSTLLEIIPNLQVLSLNDFPNYRPPEETGHTFEENALIKAVDAFKQLHIPCMSDDSGLVVPALKGNPGVFSAHYAGIHATDTENRKKLLEEMQHLQGVERNAFFECCIAYAASDLKPQCFNGRCYGSIAFHEKGTHGFGYDFLFIKEHYHLTFGELEEGIKNQISHRGKAMEKFLLFLERQERNSKKR